MYRKNDENLYSKLKSKVVAAGLATAVALGGCAKVQWQQAEAPYDLDARVVSTEASLYDNVPRRITAAGDDSKWKRFWKNKWTWITIAALGGYAIGHAVAEGEEGDGDTVYVGGTNPDVGDQLGGGDPNDGDNPWP